MRYETAITKLKRTRYVLALAAIFACGYAHATPVGTKRILNEFSPEGPALAVFDGKLFLAWTGTDSNHSLNVAESSDGLYFSSPVVFGRESSIPSAAPSIVAFNGKMYLYWTGGFHDINVATSTDGLHYANKSLVYSGGNVMTALGSTAVAVANGHIYLAWAGTDSAHTINVAESYDGVHFGTPTLITDPMGRGNSGSRYSPGLAAISDGETYTVYPAFTPETLVSGAGAELTTEVYPLNSSLGGANVSYKFDTSFTGSDGPGCMVSTYFLTCVYVDVYTHLRIRFMSRMSNGRVTNGSFFGIADEPIGNELAIGNPAIVYFNGRTIIAWTGTDGSHTINVGAYTKF
jgi:hypothetical protein